MVFFSIAYRIKRKTAGQRLVQWEGMDDEEAPYLMKEFHEHLGTFIGVEGWVDGRF